MRTPTKTGSRGPCPRRRRLGLRGLPAASAAALLVLAATAFPRAARAAEVEFYASADRDEIGLDETVNLTVTVATESSASPESLTVPESPDFRVVSKSQSQQMSFAMGGGNGPSIRRTRTIALTLAPARVGNFTLAPGKLILRGKTYETGAIKIRVVAAGQGSGAGGLRAQRPGVRGFAPGGGGVPVPPPLSGGGGALDREGDDDLLEQFFGDSRPATDSDLYVRTYLDRKQAFLGEQVTMSTYLFSRVEVSGVDGFKMPKLDGFWAEDLEAPTQINGEVKVIDGVPYRVFLLRKRALFPLTAGKLNVDPVEVDVSTGFSMLFAGRKVHRASQPLALEVQPLPSGAPANFAAANVGEWHLSAEATPQRTPLGQPFTLKVVLEGTGNLKNVAVPALPPIRGLKAYDPTTTEKVSTARSRFGGRKVAEYLLMPEQSGEITVPALSFPYFDPEARAYRTAASEPIALQVEAGAPGSAGRGAGAGGLAMRGDDRVNRLEGGELRPLRFKGALVEQAPALARRPWFLLVAVAPFALWACLGLAGLARATTRPSAGARARKAAARAREQLRRAEALIVKAPDAFYAEVSHTLLSYLAERLEAPLSGLTRAELGATLAAAGLAAERVARLLELLDLCDAGRFAPGGNTPEAMRRVRAEAQQAVAAIEATPLATGGGSGGASGGGGNGSSGGTSHGSNSGGAAGSDGAEVAR